MVSKNLLEGRIAYKYGGIWYEIFSAPKKDCLTINKFNVFDEQKTFKDFTNVSDSLNRKEYLKMFNGDELVAKVPLSWKKSFSQGVVIPHKLRNCNECATDFLCDGCDKLVNQIKEFSTNLVELKRQTPNEKGYVLLKNITI